MKAVYIHKIRVAQGVVIIMPPSQHPVYNMHPLNASYT